MARDALQTKRLIALHGWLAAALSLLLYAVMLSGTIVVFSDEIGDWSNTTAPRADLFSHPVDRHYQRIAAQVPATLTEDVIIGRGPQGTLRLFFGGARPRIDGGGVETFGREYLLDPVNGSVVSAKTGFLADLSAARPQDALKDFLVDLHVRLHVPGRWGLYLTGVLGIAMLVAALTGVLIHRNILKELFVAERPGKRIVSARDAHNLAGVWSLPFAILLAFTGAFLSFAVSLGLPVVAMVAFGGDQRAALDAVIGTPRAENAAPAATADLDRILAAARQMAQAPVAVINIHNAGRADAIVETFHGTAPGDVRGVSLEFSGTTGAFEGQSHLVGAAPSVGNTLAELAAPLHFGNFAGKASRIVWAALGAAMTYTIVSGVGLWLRRRDAPLWSGAAWAFQTVVWGLPLAMTGAAYGFFLSQFRGDPMDQVVAAFLATSFLVIAFCFLRRSDPPRHLARHLRRALGVGLLCLPLLRLQVGGISWGEAIMGAEANVVFVDALCLLGAGIFLAGSRRARLSAAHP